MEKNYRLKIK